MNDLPSYDLDEWRSGFGHWLRIVFGCVADAVVIFLIPIVLIAGLSNFVFLGPELYGGSQTECAVRHGSVVLALLVLLVLATIVAAMMMKVLSLFQKVWVHLIATVFGFVAIGIAIPEMNAFIVVIVAFATLVATVVFMIEIPEEWDTQPVQTGLALALIAMMAINFAYYRHGWNLCRTDLFNSH